MDNDKLDKVIEGLKVCTNPATKRGCLDGICPYDGKGCRGAMERDALELLKEKREGSWTVLEDCSNRGIYCSECHMKIFDFTHKPKDKLSRYCPHCGSKNEQFFRDGEVVFR